jgi:hypothetical protein
VSKPSQIGTLFGMTALFGVLPFLLTLLVFSAAPNAPNWLLGFFYLGFIALGSFVFNEVFGN